MPATLMTVISGMLYFGTLLVSLFFIYHEHRVPSGNLPYISDMWVYPPGNWLSRWAIIQGGILMLFVHICVWALDAGRLAITLVALIAILGLDTVGCVNWSEFHTLHIIGAAFYFGGYDLYMLLRSFAALSHSQTVSVGQMTLTGLTVGSCLATWLRWGGLAGQLEMPRDVVGPMLEWADAVCIALYAFLSLLLYGSAGSKVGLVVEAPASQLPAKPIKSSDLT